MAQRRGFWMHLFILNLASIAIASGVWQKQSDNSMVGESAKEIRSVAAQDDSGVIRVLPNIVSTIRPTDTTTPTETPINTKTFTPTSTPTLTPTPTPDPRIGKVSDHGLMWPFLDTVAQPYGPGHPLGIDIDGYDDLNKRSSEGEPVVAATSGNVVFAGGNECCSYGLYVVIVSPEGIETLYAHMSAVSVTQGQKVKRGQEIGKLGSSGYSTGAHLHFEVIDNGMRVDPEKYLP